MLEDLLQQLPVNLALWALPILIGIAAFYGRKLLAKAAEEAEQRLGTQNWYLLQDLASRAVQAAEQITGIDTNEEKKAFATDVLSGLAAQFNIPVDARTIDVVIEGILKMAKAQIDGPMAVATLEISE